GADSPFFMYLITYSIPQAGDIKGMLWEGGRGAVLADTRYNTRTVRQHEAKDARWTLGGLKHTGPAHTEGDAPRYTTPKFYLQFLVIRRGGGDWREMRADVLTTHERNHHISYLLVGE
ncbi:Hypothetical predicted protein, partial [Pelobates cultripes]